MIQDLGAHRLENQYDPACRPLPEDFVICWQNQRMLVSRSDTLGFPTVAELPDRDGLIYLFRVDGRAFYLTLHPVDFPGFEAVSMRQLRPRRNTYLRRSPPCIWRSGTAGNATAVPAADL